MCVSKSWMMLRRWCAARPSGLWGRSLPAPSTTNEKAEDLSNPIPACVRNGMLDQNGRPSGSGGGDPDAARDDMLFDRAEKPSSGGMLGKWRAGVAAPPGGGYQAPLWRRILVFLIKWSAIATVAFLVISVSLVF